MSTHLFPVVGVPLLPTVLPAQEDGRTLQLLPPTALATLATILHGMPPVRVSSNDNLRRESRDGSPVLNVGVLNE